jgi:hypothetical protein
MFLPFWRLLLAVNSDQALAVYFLCQASMAGIFFPGVLKTGLALLLVPGLLLLTSVLLTIADFAAGNTMLAAWYTTLADCTRAVRAGRRRAEHACIFARAGGRGATRPPCHLSGADAYARLS